MSKLYRHVVVDVETTGLSPRHGHRVIEIGAVAVVGEFTTLIDAGVPIPPRRAGDPRHHRRDARRPAAAGGSPAALQRLDDFREE
ncbi:MAG: exonuclease domain-containing protein [Pseudomonadota bacterium]